MFGNNEVSPLKAKQSLIFYLNAMLNHGDNNKQ